MTENTFYIASLVRKYFREELNADERQVLESWIGQSAENRAMFGEVDDAGYVSHRLKTWEQFNDQGIQSKIAAQFPAFIATEQGDEDTQPVPAISGEHWLRTTWWQYAAAVLLLIGAGCWFYFYTGPTGNKMTETKAIPAQKDVLPGSDKATLTLSGGRQVPLTDTAAVIQDGHLSINNSGGELSYAHATVVAMNTMTTPKGGQYKLTLEDGTRVWLNAASSITYPTAFKGSSREVIITGEVYLEVARNNKKPFIVSFGQSSVEVLGTSFNINTYPDEMVSRTTLIEGSVRMRTGHQQLLLKPGQQAVGKGDGLSLHQTPNLKQVLAWKNGAFDFNGLDFAACMRQMERWYDIQVVYDGPVPTSGFWGEVDRSLTLMEVMEGLNGVATEFRLEGRTLHVLP